MTIPENLESYVARLESDCRDSVRCTEFVPRPTRQRQRRKGFGVGEPRPVWHDHRAATPTNPATLVPMGVLDEA